MKIWKKEPLKMPLIFFSIAHQLLEMQLTLKSSYQLETAPGFEIDIWVYFSFQLWDLIWCKPVHASYMLPRTLWVHMHTSPVGVEDLGFLIDSVRWLLHTFSLPFYKVLWDLMTGTL